MPRRVKEICQIGLVVFLLYVLSIDENISSAQTDSSSHSWTVHNARKPLPQRGKDKHFQLSALTKAFLMKLKNQTDIPTTLHSVILINPSNVCPYNTSLDYLIIVNSATENSVRRSTIRATFGQNNLFGHLVHRLVFLLGTTPDSETTQNIKEEAAQHNDIVQGDFLDTYHNLTLKGVMGLRWVNQSCHKPKLIIKIDDDIFVNVVRVVTSWIPKFSARHYAMGCELLSQGKSQIYRDRGKKWKVDRELFKGFDSFPFPHCKGYYVVMTGDLVAPMLTVAGITPFFWIDDVYLYGLLPLTIGYTRMLRLWRDATDSRWYAGYCWSRGECQYVVYNSGNHFHSGTALSLWANITGSLTQAQKQELHWRDKVQTAM